MSDPDKVKQELIKVFSWQYLDGHTLRSWVPLDTVYYSDGPMWLVITTCGYIKFTDDVGFLDEVLPYYDLGEGTVQEHLYKAVDRIESDKGPHGLPLSRFADWNDALNLSDPNAESVFLAMGLAYILKEMSELINYIGNIKSADKYFEKYLLLKKIINKVAQDEKGGYYVRGFSGDKVIGGSLSEVPMVYINPQTWSILSDVIPEERLPKVLSAIDNIIDTELGCPVNVPAFNGYDKNYGRISAQLAGTWENGSSYCHVTSFKTSADVKIDRGDEVLKSLMKIFPDSSSNPISKSGATPFALTSSYSTNPEIWGKAGRPWLPGTQSWAMRTIVEGLLGVKRKYGGFEISPAFPSCWEKAECRISLKETTYIVKIKRFNTDKKMKVYFGGKLIESRFIPYKDSGTHIIQVEV